MYHLKKKKISEYKQYLKLKKHVEIEESKLLSKYPFGTSVSDMKEYDRYEIDRLYDELKNFPHRRADYHTDKDIETFSNNGV
jgi:hypothetical protein